MLLRPTISQSPLHQHSTVSLSSSHSYSLSFPRGNSTPIRSIKTPKNKAITCSISQVYSYGTVDYEKGPVVKWIAIYKRISFMRDPDKGSSSVLNQWENEGRRLTKWDLCRVVKELRKYKLYRRALEVYEWMNNRGERFRITSSDTAIQLDLIAKVHGIQTAEDYFLKVPETLKDNRIYGALLNAYVRAKMTQNAESLITQMKEKGYANQALSFNVMMTLYLKLNDYDKVESVISEMVEKRIPLDTYSYNMWLTSCGSQGSVEKMERVYQQMKLDPSINPNWTTYSTMATMYMRMDEIEKAEECLKMIESRITGRDRIPYHFLISHYGSTGNKDEVYRIWDVYKQTFPSIPNMGYHALISALIRCDDIHGAESMYDEWLSVKSSFDPRIANLLMSRYSSKGLSKKAEAIFQEMVERGGRPNATTFEILAEGHIRGGRINEALSCLNEAVSASGAKNWKPKPVNVSTILKVCEEENDTASKEVLLGVVRQSGGFDDEAYMSYIPLSNQTANNKPSTKKMTGDDDEVGDDGDGIMLGQLQGSL